MKEQTGEGTEGALDAQYRQAAMDTYTGHGASTSDGDIDIDADAVVSESDEGAYVAAWVWVPREDLPS